jgi:LysR family transcriptional regulator for metE and metH
MKMNILITLSNRSMRMALEVRHLSLVKAVAESGSISRAGVRLHLTQSALSHQLRSIEEQLGVRLFHRHNRRMVLSKPGERLLASANQILADLEHTEADIKRIADEKEGLLRISMECYTTYHWLPPILKVFNRKFPKVDVQIVAEATAHPAEFLVARKLDLAIVPDVIRERRISLSPLFRDKLVAVMSPDHPLAGKSYLRPQDFADQPLFLYSDREKVEAWTFYNKFLAPAGIVPKQITYIQLTEGMIEMAKAGLGIAVLAHWAVDPEIKRKTVKAVSLSRSGFIRHWCAATLKNALRPLYLDAFIKLLANTKMPAMKYY